MAPQLGLQIIFPASRVAERRQGPPQPCAARACLHRVKRERVIGTLRPAQVPYIVVGGGHGYGLS
jgi:hypothetical protein